ncbi:MAG TPA: uroporphyrinogen decarboxylase family protein [Armatimonadota bacterium]|jgi:hypothetical protein
MADAFFETYMGRGPRQVTHYEHWSCPDAETYLTGIDYYAHPQACRARLQELYPELNLPVPETDDPKPHPRLSHGAGATSDADRHTVRWGDSETATWEHGEAIFKTIDDVLNFSPLAKGDFSDFPFVVMAQDFSSEEIIYQRYRAQFPAEWGDTAPEGVNTGTWFYNTLFMWPLLTFGWEWFLEVCLLDEFEPIMDEFAEINRRVFRAFARLPVKFVTCHDDIVTSRGPVCSPAWMHKYIFPRYEEYWGILKDAGKEVIFMADGCMDEYADDVLACGARGIVTEPYTDFKAIARKHENVALAGEGDNRILTRNDPAEIRAMVASMAETARMSQGYFMCIGNHIPWNIPPQAIKCYLDTSRELASRA